MTTATPEAKSPLPSRNGGTAPQAAPLTPQMRAEEHIRRILGDKDLQIAILRAQLDEALEKVKALEQ